MSIPKLLGILAFFIFGVIIFLQWPKNRSEKESDELRTETPLVFSEEKEEVPAIQELKPVQDHSLQSLSLDADLPQDIDRMARLFQPIPPLLPIVETVAFTSRVDWLSGRPAYLGDYAAHFQTSKHFISRSLRGEGQYFVEAVSRGERFNVFRTDKKMQFHLIVDLSRLKLWTYYFDEETNERVLLKTYPVSLGKLDPSKPSGCLTPTGVYLLGNEVAVYKEGIKGNYRSKPVDMITVFGVRWIPFDREIANCSSPAKGFGIHGVPWQWSEPLGHFEENKECIGRYESEGCIRLLTRDIEELFSVVITKPTYIHVVKDFFEAQLPGKVKEL